MVQENKLHLFCRKFIYFASMAIVDKALWFSGEFFSAGKSYFSVTRFDSYLYLQVISVHA